MLHIKDVPDFPSLACLVSGGDRCFDPASTGASHSSTGLESSLAATQNCWSWPP